MTKAKRTTKTEKITAEVEPPAIEAENNTAEAIEVSESAESVERFEFMDEPIIEVNECEQDSVSVQETLTADGGFKLPQLPQLPSLSMPSFLNSEEQQRHQLIMYLAKDETCLDNLRKKEKLYRKVDKMSIEDVQLYLRLLQENNSDLATPMINAGLKLANNLTDRFISIDKQQLNSITKEDKDLHDALSQLFNLHILNYLSAPVKSLMLYTSDIMKARVNNQSEQTQ